MDSAQIALRRMLRGADVIDVLGFKPKPELEAEPAPPLPDLITFARDWVYWPHIEKLCPDTGGPLPVRGLNPMQEAYLRDRSAFRVDDDGQVIPGADLVFKSRRIRFTSLAFTCVLWSCLKIPGSRHCSVFQVAKKELFDNSFDQIGFCLRRLPAAWIGLEPGEDPVSALRIGNAWKFRNDSRWLFQSAGHSRKVAGQLLRGQRVDGLHLSEARAYAEPEEVWASAGKAVQKGWVICETNPPTDAQQWTAQEYALTRDGVGSFAKAHYYPWHMDPLKRIARGTPLYDSVMSPEFVERLESGVIEAEDRLGLDDEQRAFRRRERCCGSAWQRKLSIAENSETAEECYVSSEQVHWLDPACIEQARLTAAAHDPVFRVRLGSLHSVSCWVTPDEYARQYANDVLVCFADTALKSGKDYSAIRCRSTAPGFPVIAEVHGRALATELADAIVWLLTRYVGGVSNSPRYSVAVERNAGTGKDLIEHLMRRGLRIGHRTGLYAERVADNRPGRRGQTRSRAGLYTGAATRSAMLDRISLAVEGYAWDPVTNEPQPAGNTVLFKSSFLVSELAGLIEKEGMIQAGTGHDDLAIADGGCLLIASRLAQTRPTGVQIGGKRPAARTVKKSIARRRRKQGRPN